MAGNKSRKELTLTRDNIDYIKKEFARNHSEGVDRCINSYRTLSKTTLRELKRYFTKEEVLTLLRAQGNKSEPIERETQYSSMAYIAYLNHKIQSGSVEFINKKQTFSKIKNMTSAEVYFLREALEIARKAHHNKNAIDDLIDLLC